MKEGIYRKSALESLAVGERLDTALQVVGPASILVVLAAVVTIGTALAWSILGRVPRRVYGDGLMLHDGSIEDVTSMADGQVTKLTFKVGDVVSANEVIAYIDQPELKKQLASLEGRLADYTNKFAQLEQLDDQGKVIKRAAFDQQRAAVGYALREMKQQLAFFQEKLKSDTTLLERGLATPTAVAETRQKVLDLNDAMHTRQAERQTIAYNVLDSARTLEERRYDLSMRVSDTRRELEELQKRIDTQSVVQAKTPGRIIEIKVTEGDAVTRGRPIATIETVSSEPGGGFVAEVYVPVMDGKRVRVGMPVKLAPSVVKPEESGYLEGLVDSVSPFPATEQSMLRAVRNESLVGSLLKGGPVYEVRVRVESDPRTPSGLKWSNGKGPPVQIASGTLVQGLITVQTRRPIELVVPALERLVTDVPPGARAELETK
jgi:HlyD family secretion protein